MARYLVATHTAALTRAWECRRCHVSGQATVNAKGEGEKRVWFSRSSAAETAHERAAEALERDADRIAALVRCPKCRSRAPGAVAGTLWHGLPDFWLAIVITVLVAAVLLVKTDGTVLPIVCSSIVFVGVLAIGEERRRWTAASRAQVRLSAPKPPRPEIEPARIASGPVSTDPFRAPPAPPPLVIVQHAAPAAAPIVVSESAEPPAFLR